MKTPTRRAAAKREMARHYNGMRQTRSGPSKPPADPGPMPGRPDDTVGGIDPKEPDADDMSPQGYMRGGKVCE